MTEATNNASGLIRMVRSHGSVCWEELDGESFELCQQDSDYECREFYTAPPADNQGTAGDKYRAELYDEVWQKARDMGYGNVTEALVALERLRDAPPAAAVAMPEDSYEAQKLVAFANFAISAALEGCDLDGGTIQDEAEKLGLLERRTVTGPCCGPDNGFCWCAHVSGFPTECLRKSAALNPATDHLRDAAKMVPAVEQSAMVVPEGVQTAMTNAMLALEKWNRRYPRLAKRGDEYSSEWAEHQLRRLLPGYREAMLAAAPTPEPASPQTDAQLAWWKEHLSVHLAILFRATGENPHEAEQSVAQILRRAELIAPAPEQPAKEVQ